MATGTGKTRICIRTVLPADPDEALAHPVLVDRNALGSTADAFTTCGLESLQTSSQSWPTDRPYDQSCTLRRFKRCVAVCSFRTTIAAPPTFRRLINFDCIIVDECRRGYLLSTASYPTASFSSATKPPSPKYRRVLDHFDAVKIGSTATPALHTKEIFGPPVFSYTYREAVMDGFSGRSRAAHPHQRLPATAFTTRRSSRCWSGPLDPDPHKKSWPMKCPSTWIPSTGASSPSPGTAWS